MISNSDLFFAKAMAFQDKRAELVTNYEKKYQELKRFEGSKGYAEDVKKLNDKHSADLKALQEEYYPVFQTIIGGMMDAIGRRTVPAPTNDQINLLNVLKMKKNPTLEECRRTAEAVKDNPIAVSVVSEIAKEHNLMRNFDNLCQEMSSNTASELVSGLKTSVEEFLRYDTTRASRVARQFHSAHYGESDTPLTKIPLFADKEGCYHTLLNIDSNTLRKFSEIVDA